jgi:hypothetical protein
MNAPRRHAQSNHSPLGAEPRAEADQRAAHVTPPPFRWQFGLPALLGTMLLLCLPFAIWGAILRGDPDEQMVLTLLCIAAPLGVLVLAAISVSIAHAIRRLRHCERSDDAP